MLLYRIAERAIFSFVFFLGGGGFLFFLGQRPRSGGARSGHTDWGPERFTAGVPDQVKDVSRQKEIRGRERETR